jgi:MoCo/4Fe-4S cofactor protein with predicted Tat translocation signal
MKRILQHPAEPANGKKYWRSLGELADTPEFRAQLEREFPAGAAEMEGDEVSRRSFLQLMGASMALAGIGMTGCRRPEGYVVPYTKSPEWIIPGKILQYATAIPRRGGGVPLLATSLEGRPTRVDGNPLPSGMKGSDSVTQASILDLYDPDRSRHYKQNGAPADAAKFFELLGSVRTAAQASGGAGLAILWEPSTSPTRARLQAELQRQFPQIRFATHDAAGNANEEAAFRMALGGRYQALRTYENADIVVAVESDFLGAEEGGLEAVRGFAKRRRVRNTSDTMNRLYVIESRFTSTGGSADHRLRLAAKHHQAYLAALASELAALGASSLSSFTTGKAALEGTNATWIRELAKDLWSRRGRALVVAGNLSSTATHLLVLAINEALGSFGQTLRFIPAQDPESLTLPQLADAIQAGSVQTLIISNVNPAYDAPADLRWADLQKKVPQVVHVGYREDETSVGVSFHAPLAHYLESWGDLRSENGTYLSVQPMILPLFNGVTQLETLAALAGLPQPKGPELIQATFKQIAPAGNWNKFVHDGFLAGSAPAPISGGWNASAASQTLASSAPSSADGVELVFYPCTKIDDGRHANNGWLQELPDMMTKVSWDNAALVSPATAKKLGVAFSELSSLFPDELKGLREIDHSKAPMVTLEANGARLDVAVYVHPGQADDSIALALGYGRTHAGRVGNGIGFNAYPLRTAGASHFVPAVTVTKTGKTYSLAQTQEHHSMEGRALAREATLDEYKKDPTFAQHLGPDSHMPKGPAFYSNPSLTDQHQWGMVIDLNSCVGCSACVIACQSENNIPIVGKDQVGRGREMHWLRIDRYFSDTPDDPQMFSQPVLCMHCENAPCETVCPVNATVHSEDGLNVMAYNRCIGTRYCANNCPYKVRRFNYFDYNKRSVGDGHGVMGFLYGAKNDNLYEGPLGKQNEHTLSKMQKNPNVTVRMRGVIEKCTFCVQRIEEAKISALAKAGPSPETKVKTDSFETACQTACPAEAIVFGNMKDPDSAVSKLKGTEREYGLLEYLNTRPRVTYLARLRNPNPAMPGAEKIGLSAMGGHEDHGDGHGHGEASHEKGPEAGHAPAPGHNDHH